MVKRFLVTALAAALFMGMDYAHPVESAPTTIHKTAPTSGKQMYISYCASCHGVTGRGDGPAAAALKMPPTDLSLLSRNNHGKFPDAHIVTVLQYGTPILSHGSAEMPVWGPVLGKMDKANPEFKQVRISSLIQYLKTLQAK